MDIIQNVILTSFFVFSTVSMNVNAYESFASSNKLDSERKNDSLKSDKFWNQIHEYGFEPWHLILVFFCFLLLSVLTCYICSGCSKYFKRKNPQCAIAFLDQIDLDNKNLPSNERHPDDKIIITRQSIRRPLLLKCYANLDYYQLGLG